MVKSKRLISALTSLALIATTGIVHAEEPVEYFPEQVTDTSFVCDGEVYIATYEAEIPEESSSGYLIRLSRFGDTSSKTSVRISMTDITAEFGKDYTVSLYDAGLTEGFVHNRFASQSMIGILDTDDITEYNYADALIDGTLEDEDAGDPELTEKLAKEMLGTITPNDPVKVTSDTEAFPSGEGVSEADGGVSLQISDLDTTNLYMRPQGVVRGTSDSSLTTSNCESDSLSLSQAFESATGLKDDKQPMTNGSTTNLFSGIDRSLFLEDDLSYLNENLSSAYFIVDFAEGETDKYLEVKAIDNSIGEGNKMAYINVMSENGSAICNAYSKCTLTVIDDEPYSEDKLSFSEATYSPTDGYVTIEVNREGSCLDMVSATVITSDGTATSGRDYSAVNAQLDFPPGLKKRTFRIPIVSDYLEEDATFDVSLVDANGCEIGNQGDATVTIGAHSQSIDVSVLGADMNLGSKFYGDALDWSRFSGSRDSNANGSSYSRKDGSNWRMYTEDHSFISENAYTYANISLSNTYAYSGFSVRWKREAGSPSYGGTLFQVDGNTLRDTSNERWDMQTEDFYLPKDTVTVNNLKVSLKRSGGFWGKSPTLTMEYIKPIMRPFKIELAQAAPIKLLDKNGNYVDNTTLSDYASKNRCILSNATQEGTGYLISVCGYDATVRLADAENPVAYIKALEIVNPSTGASKVVSDNLPIGTTSASFKITEDNLRDYASYIKYENNGSQNMYGNFKLRPVLANLPAKINLVGDERATFSAYIPAFTADSTATKATQQNIFRTGLGMTNAMNLAKDINLADTLNGSGDSNAHIGDCIKYTTTIKDAYSATYTWNEIKISPIVPAKASYGKYRVTGTDYTYDNVQYSEITVKPQLVKNDNAIIVRVKKEDVASFKPKYGVFNYPAKENGKYYDYTIASSKAITVGRTYEMAAYSLDENLLPTWTPAYDSRSFAQGYFFYVADEDADKNVIYLSLTSPSDDKEYSIKGKFYYDDVAIGTSTSIGNWNPVPNVVVMVDQLHYGASDNKGAFESYPTKGGKYLRIKYTTGGKSFLKDITLTSSDDNLVTKNVDVYTAGKAESVKKTFHSIDLGNITISNQVDGAPRIASVICTNDSGVAGATIQIKDNSLVNLMANIDNNGVTYYDTDGVEHTESVTKVDFLVFDGTTHKQKCVLEGAQNVSGNTWLLGMALSTKDREKYQASDLLYARITTNRYIGNGKSEDGDGNMVEVDALKETTYAPIRTTYTFTEDNPEAPIVYDFDPMPDGGYYSLPVVGDLSMNIVAAGFNFGTEAIPNGTRLQFGKAFTKGTQHQTDENGDKKVVSDANTVFDASTVLKGEAWHEMEDRIRNEGSDLKKLGTQGLGLPIWEVSPFVGIYLDFHMTYTKDVGSSYFFSGGGIYFGINGLFRYTYYMLVLGFPVYVGGSVNGTVLAEGGFKRKPNTDVTLKDVLGSATKLRDGLNFDFTLRAYVVAQIFAGVGICGTFGARGGFEFDFSFIWQPTIQKMYPEVSKYGFYLNAKIGIWIDAILFTLPVSVINKDKYIGYFEDVEKLKKSGTVVPGQTFDIDDDEDTTTETESMSSTLQAITDLSATETPTARMKVRSALETEFLPTDNSPATRSQAPLVKGERASSAGEGIPSDGIQDNLEATYQQESQYTLTKNGFDAPAEKLVSYGDGKQFLVYLDDDKSRPDNERTALMYTIYDGSSWSTPAKVQDDGTFDTQPSVTETENDIIVAWASHDAGDNLNTQTDFLKATDIYTVRFNKETGVFSTVEKLTDDEYYNANPRAIYDELTGDVIVIYQKSEVDSEDLSSEYSPVTNKCQLVYMLYDASKGAWARDYFYPNEVADGADQTALLNSFKGQRFIPSPITDFGMSNPVILDVEASIMPMYLFPDYYDPNKTDYTTDELTEIVNYMLANEYTEGIISYTVDADNDVNTTDDRELFIQLYNFKEHNFSDPIRVTDNSVSDTTPKLVHGLGCDTQLFWVENAKNVNTLSLSDCLQGHVDNNGVYDGKSGFGASRVTPLGIANDDGDTNIADYTAFEDTEGTTYVCWADAADGSKELYLSALVTNYDVENGISYSWSEPVRLTYSDNRINDLPVIGFDENSEPVIIANSYVVDYEDPDLTPTDTALTLYTYKKIPSLELISSDAAYNEDDNTVTTTITYKNDGLKSAFLYDIKGYLTLDGTKVAGTDYDLDYTDVLVDSSCLTAGETATFVNTFQMPDGAASRLADFKIYAEATEYSIADTLISEVSLFDDTQSLELSNIEVTQCLDYFILQCDVTNTGTLTSSAGNKLNITTSNLYQVNGEAYNEFASDELPTLASGERKTIYSVLDVPEGTFNAGYGNLAVSLVDKDDNTLDQELAALGITAPFNFKVNGSDDNITLYVGDTLNLNGTYEGTGMFGDGTVIYASTDPTIASVTTSDSAKLTAVSAGETYLTMTTDEYGGLGCINVTVLPKKRNNGKGITSSGGSGASTTASTNTTTTSGEPSPMGKVSAKLTEEEADALISWLIEPFKIANIPDVKQILKGYMVK